MRPDEEITAPRRCDPTHRPDRLGGGRGAVALALSVVVRWGPQEPRSSGSAPSAGASDGPVSMQDLQYLEHLAWLVDTRTAEEEAYVEAKFALLNRPVPDAMLAPVPHLVLPTDELAALERLRSVGRLSDGEYETLRRRILLRI